MYHIAIVLSTAYVDALDHQPTINMAEPVAGSAQVTDVSHEATAPAIPEEEVYTLSFKHAGKTHESLSSVALLVALLLSEPLSLIVTATSSDCLFDLKASICMSRASRPRSSRSCLARLYYCCCAREAEGLPTQCYDALAQR